MSRLALYDYHNMIAILEKSEHNVDFHQIVDFVEASHISPSFSGRIVPLFATMLVTQGKGSGTLTKPHHTPSLEAQQSPHNSPSSLLHLTATPETIPSTTPTEIPTLRQYFRRAKWIAQSTTLPTAAGEPTSLSRDESEGEAFLTISGLEAGQDRENIIKTSALPHDSTPRVTSIDADEGSMEQQLQEFTNLCTHLQRHQTVMASKINTQDLEISNLKARIKLLEDKDGGGAEPSREDATIKGRSLETGEEAGVEKNIESGSNDTKELVNVLTSMDAANILISGVQAEKMVESDTPKKKKLQEQINVQMAREIKEEMARDAQRMNEQIARDAEIAKIHAEEELQMLIDGLDRNNEVIAKHLHEYEQAAADLTIGEKIELINVLVKYQDHHAKILKSKLDAAAFVISATS
nr:hypothetical protein [Tanacetum cinerariifolium]